MHLNVTTDLWIFKYQSDCHTVTLTAVSNHSNGNLVGKLINDVDDHTAEDLICWNLREQVESV
jgi:hypothetical protein